MSYNARQVTSFKVGDKVLVHFINLRDIRVECLPLQDTVQTIESSSGYYKLVGFPWFLDSSQLKPAVTKLGNRLY